MRLTGSGVHAKVRTICVEEDLLYVPFIVSNGTVRSCVICRLSKAQAAYFFQINLFVRLSPKTFRQVNTQETCEILFSAVVAAASVGALNVETAPRVRRTHRDLGNVRPRRQLIHHEVPIGGAWIPGGLRGQSFPGCLTPSAPPCRLLGPRHL